MGMFDYLVCQAPLPGTPPSFVTPGHQFQTKDLACEMTCYTITADGRLVAAGIDQEYTGTINFYDSNCAGGWGDIPFTRDGEDYESVDYRATFVGGRLAGAVVETARERKPALHTRHMRPDRPEPTAADVAECQRLERESLVGRTMHLRWGGGDKGNDVTVVAEGPKEWVARLPDGTFEVIDRRTRGATFFASAAEADADDAARAAEFDAVRERYEQLLTARGRAGEPGTNGDQA